MKAVVILSGGQDSTTCLAYALRSKQYEEVIALTFDYGQRHRIEIEAAKKIAEEAGVEHRVIKLSGISEVAESNLLNSESNISENHSINPNLPSSFVPGRNLIFITYAAAFAYSRGFDTVITGVCQTDYSGYPDCRQETMRYLEDTIRQGMDFQNFRIITPLMHLTKAETVVMMEELGYLHLLKYSHTCYNGKKPPCGECPACVLRAKGFEEAGVPDPLLEP